MTNLKKLQQEAREEYAKEFGGPVLKNGRMAQFLDQLIEKTVSAVEESVVPEEYKQTPLYSRTWLAGHETCRGEVLEAFKTFRNHD